MTSTRKSTSGDWSAAIFLFVFIAVPFIAANSDGHHAGRGLLASFVGFVIGVIGFVIRDNGRQRRARVERTRISEDAARLARVRHATYLKSDLGKIDQMQGIEFEQYVAARLRENGWAVSTTSATGDYGVDLIAKRSDESMAVQCKRYAKPIGVSAVQQVVSGAMHHHCWKSMVVSNQEFTKAAKMLAETHNCVLIGRARLLNGIP